MNPRVKAIQVNKCTICDYPFSDMHHLYPRRIGGKKTIALCPNHHRAANIIQVMTGRAIMDGSDFTMVFEFAKTYFDKGFFDIVGKLIDAHCEEELRVANEEFGYNE